MLDDELAQELLVHAVQVVEGVDQREARTHAEKQRDLADELMQVDDQRRPLRQTRDVDGGVDGERRRARAAFGSEERQRDARARAVLGRAIALDRALQRRLKAVAAARRPARRATTPDIRWRPRASPGGSGRARPRRRRRRSTSTATTRAGARWPPPTRCVPLRMSTTARSGHVLPACFSSISPIDRPLERSSVVIVERNSESLVVMTAESCAMGHRADVGCPSVSF